MPSSVNEDELSSRVDWRDLPFVTIDGQDAKDYDDAVYVEKTQDGLRRMWPLQMFLIMWKKGLF